MSGPFDKPPMTQAQFFQELRMRGFHFCKTRNKWTGPFGITITGVANESNHHTTSGRDTPTGVGSAGVGGIGPGVSGLRKTLLADIDEQLRAKRGLPRPLFRPNYDPPN